MKHGSLVLEKKEYVYIKSLLNLSEHTEEDKVQTSLDKFAEELKSAKILDEEEMLDDVVRLNTVVTITSGDDWKKTIQIVKPTEKDLKNNKISILTPIGIALFGYALNDLVHWDLPGGRKEVKILKVTQKEGEESFSTLI
ncbi:transcription elongation factor GreAB [Tenacibaculum discolor]|uniref:GreA/GreB family elongation factor n=1 Tax=Tenacibaculum discolor TaxID=361581 RepID=A0A2G1BY00_9FLAO|nr:GreA/GreB family elongation factor [Tenacibaculum discolor]MDP2541154.1 GreA/GreB family elongation factor [Tenacibaculum discolor]PHN98864.1 transcription elongation factor GreAB [Tenacibaculum discolor]PHO01533.1 transcription elongation factor GreAB [Rhodobacteraceae bacterium 4F10]